MEEQEFGKILKTFFLAAMIGLACPVILTLLAHHFHWIEAGVSHKECRGISRYTSFYGEFDFRDLVVILPVMVYWYGGLANLRWLFNLHSCWRTSTARILLACSLGALFFIIPILSMIWSLSLQMGVAPRWSYDELVSVHGPWNGMPILDTAVMVAIILPLISFFLSLFSFVFKPNRFSVVVWGVSPFIFFLLFISHFWLID
jgi:hypothetical protein